MNPATATAAVAAETKVNGAAGPAATILVVDDEPSIRKVLESRLAQEGYRVVTTGDGLEALSRFSLEPPDLVLLDMMLPGLDGFDLCRRIRRFSWVPMIALTARAEEADRLLGFEVGVDDYVTKPFSLAELVLRIQAILRRSLPSRGVRQGTCAPMAMDGGVDGPVGLPAPQEAQGSPGAPAAPVPSGLAEPAGQAVPPGLLGVAGAGKGLEVAGHHGALQHGALRIDPRERTASIGGVPVSLTAKEFDLLWLLASRPSQVFTRAQLVRLLWRDEVGTDPANVTVLVSRLREKIDPLTAGPSFVRTVWGIGYRFCAAGQGVRQARTA